MDGEYDKCNMVMAQGEVNGFNEKFLSYILKSFELVDLFKQKTFYIKKK